MNAISSTTRLALLLAISLGFAGTQAFGQTMISPPQSPAAFTITGITGSQNLTFDGFNTSLGTLTSVTIDLTNVVVSGEATLTANTTGQEVFSANLTGSYTLSDGTNTVMASVATAVGPDETVPNGSTYYVGAAPNNGFVGTSPPVGFAPASSSSQNSPPTVITTGLAFYEGGSNAVVLDLTGHNTLNSSTSGGFNTSVFGTGTGDVTVVYTYTPVPEPAQTAAWMIGFGLCVLGGRKYFKK